MFSFYPGLEAKVSIDDWIKQRSVLHEQAFKRVKPLKGAVKLVKSLHDAGVPIAIATGSNTANFHWKTVGLIT
jgi:pseudouridine-5'-monophosphatase